MSAMSKTKPNELLYTEDVSKLLGVGVRTVNRWVNSGRLQPAAQGKGIRGARVFHRADVEALAKAIAA